MSARDFLRTAQERGYVHQVTDIDGLSLALKKGPVTGYNGFDATADSLHVGHLLPIMLMRLFQKTGNRPIALMGGGTTLIGDPSGRDTSRTMMTAEVVSAYIQNIVPTFERFLTFGEGPTDAILVNNADWLSGLMYIDVLRQVGSFFSVNRMLTMDSVRLRLEREQPLTFLEFNYMILQAYDFQYLAAHQGCTLQLGGSDQWGNIVMGIDLVRRMHQTETYGVTVPLLTTSSGEKMGKTAKGAVWLHPDRLDPFEYWQFWRNTTDVDVGRFLRLFTEMPLDEIARLEVLEGAELNEAKSLLATETTRMLHGEQAAQEAVRQARALFRGEGVRDDRHLPRHTITGGVLEGGYFLADALVDTGLAPSKSEARRLIRGRGVKIEARVIEDDQYRLSLADCDARFSIVLTVGKKHFGVIDVKDSG